MTDRIPQRVIDNVRKHGTASQPIPAVTPKFQPRPTPPNPQEEQERAKRLAQNTLEKSFQERIPNLVHITTLATPNETSRVACAALSLIYGLWYQIDDNKKFVFDRDKLVKISKPYNRRANEIEADDFRGVIRSELPTVSTRMAGHILITIEMEWRKNRHTGPKLKAFEQRRTQILRAMDTEETPVNTVDLFDFLLELSVPAKTSD